MTEPPRDNGRAAISVREAVKRSGMSRSTIARMIRHRLIPSTRVCGRRLIDLAAFDAVILRDGAPTMEQNRDVSRDAQPDIRQRA